jgi:undecaprenyl pyrophosphate synthase
MGGMGGMGGMEEPVQDLTSQEIGRLYELKKIYTRLMSLESYLSASTDESLLKLRNIVGQSVELFEIIITNFKQYKDKIDDIIVIFYKFLDQSYTLLRNYYKQNMREEQ